MPSDNKTVLPINSNEEWIKSSHLEAKSSCDDFIPPATSTNWANETIQVSSE